MKNTNGPMMYEDENIDVWDAADIWRSNGEDEDYMFGYTREELLEALDE